MARDPDPPLTPGTLADTIGFRLRVAQIVAYRHFEAELSRRHGIAPRYLGLLGIIEAHPGQPQSRLAEAISLKRSSLVPIIDRLEQEGLVERRASPDDKRLKSVWLTQKGRRTVADLTARARAQEDRLAAGMSPEERQMLVRLLGQVIENLA
jgi:DNA-binding MarR family transcriptional regulator